MRNELKKIAIIGGDKRQEYAAEILSQQGYLTAVYGIPGKDTADSLQEAVTDADIILGPVPFSKDKRSINSRESKRDMELTNLLDLMAAGQLLAGGCLPCFVIQYCELKQVACFDYMEQENLAVFNSIATAEGAIAEAMIHHPSNLHGGKALVLGYGRCARTLADKLKALSVQVTVCARSHEAHALAYAQGCQTLSFEILDKRLGEFDFIFNTIPSMVLDEIRLRKVSASAVIIDIASAPGGVDFTAAPALGLNASLCLGLPGKYSPFSSAKAITEEVLQHYIDN